MLFLQVFCQKQYFIQEFYPNTGDTTLMQATTKSRTFLPNFSHTLSITAFLIPFLLMLIIFMVQGIYPFGNRSFLHIDMYHQYFPFLTEFYHKLKSGDSLFYSWNTGIGSNFLALYAYYLASPFNWLCIFVPESLLIEFQSYMVVFKIGLCGLTSYYYFKKHFKQETPSFLFFSTFYALSGYMAAYNWNVMWLDCIFLAPLIVLGLEQLVERRQYKLYCLTLALSILSNFYLCIMLCIYLVLYFLLVLLKDAQNKLLACRDFAFFSLLSGGMASILLFPEMAALSISEFSGSSFPKESKSYFDLFDVLARHCMDVAVETGLDHWPNIYCGVAILVLLPLYVICKNISTKDKISRLFLLLFLLISFCTNSLTFLWHGWNYPNSLPSRQSYLYILLLLTICAEAFGHIKEFSKTELSKTILCVMAFLVLCQKLIADDAFSDRTFLLTAVFLFGYVFLLYLYRTQTRTSRNFIFLFLFVFMLEAGLNTYYTSCPTVSRNKYLADYQTYPSLTGQTPVAYSKLQRYELDNRVISNNGTLHSYPSASYFSSTVNGLITAFYEKYGLRSSKVYYTSDGLTPFTSALLNVSHIISKSDNLENDLLSLQKAEENLNLYQAAYTLPFGYVVPAALDLNQEKLNSTKKLSLSESQETESSFHNLNELFLDSKYAKDIVLNNKSADTKVLANPLENQNLLARKLGASEDIFLNVPVKNNGNTSTITIKKAGHYYAYNTNKKVDQATVSILSAEGEETETLTYQKLTNRYILDLGKRKSGETISITSSDEKELNFIACFFHKEPLEELLAQLNSHPLEISEFSSTKIKGSITANTSGHLILSMPYEPGWKITIDGNSYEPQLFEGMFLSVPITEGHHEIALTYVPTGFLAGSIVSLLCLTIFLMYLFWDIRKKKSLIQPEINDISNHERHTSRDSSGSQAAPN